jgi:Cu/Ag efflux protein CusF
MTHGVDFRVLVMVVLLACLAVAVPLIAAEQFAGEVLKVDVAAKKITVKKPDGNRFTFVVDDQTSFAGTRKSIQDLTKGDKVSVEFQVTSGQYKAVRIAAQ